LVKTERPEGVEHCFKSQYSFLEQN
jgi:hypothetical protein